MPSKLNLADLDKAKYAYFPIPIVLWVVRPPGIESLCPAVMTKALEEDMQGLPFRAFIYRERKKWLARLLNAMVWSRSTLKRSYQNSLQFFHKRMIHPPPASHPFQGVSTFKTDRLHRWGVSNSLKLIKLCTESTTDPSVPLCETTVYYGTLDELPLTGLPPAAAARGRPTVSQAEYEVIMKAWHTR
jgi:hypothetical protein